MPKFLRYGFVFEFEWVLLSLVIFWRSCVVLVVTVSALFDVDSVGCGCLFYLLWWNSMSTSLLELFVKGYIK